MICTLDVAVQAANPTMPLMTWKSFRGSPTSVRVRNVPKKIGAWEISKVRVIVNYPDNSSRSVEAVLTGGVWVATIAACEVVGESANGYVIEADGKDERGEIVAGYVLGTGDVKIYDIDATITPGEETYYVHLVDTKPETPHKGDLVKTDDGWEIFDGSAWTALGGGGGGLALVPSQEFENCWELVKKYSANQLASAAEVEVLAETASGSQIVGKLNEILTAIKGA